MSTAPDDLAALATPLRDSLLRLLEAIAAPEQWADRHEDLKDRIEEYLPSDHLIDALDAVTNLIIDIWQESQRERQAWRVFSSKLDERLQELDKVVQNAEQQAMTTYYGGRKAEADLERQIADIESRLYSASSIEQLRAYVHQRVAVIRARLEDAKGKSAQSFSAWQAQLNKLADAVRDIEHQLAELRRRFAQDTPHVLLDPVTGIASRWAYDQQLQQELARLRRYGTPLVVQLWQVDDFKGLRRSYGRRVCERVLTLVAKILTGSLREADYIAHYDAQRFSVLLPQTELASAEWAADRLSRSIATAGFHHRGAHVRITVSCGYTAATKEDTAQSIYERTNGALQQAMESGKGHYCAG